MCECALHGHVCVCACVCPRMRVHLFMCLQNMVIAPARSVRSCSKSSKVNTPPFASTNSVVCTSELLVLLLATFGCTGVLYAVAGSNDGSHPLSFMYLCVYASCHVCCRVCHVCICARTCALMRVCAYACVRLCMRALMRVRAYACVLCCAVLR